MRFIVRDRGTTEQHDSADYVAFTEHMLVADQLPIREWLPRLPVSSFFLVAATGLGKTVAVPLYLFSRACANAKHGRPPTIYVVEPTIPICLNEVEHMNARFDKFMSARERPTYHPFGAITGAGKLHTTAPIRFITTGVFELLAQDLQLQPTDCRFIIDEAHRVLEQQPGAEIALAVLRSRGFTVDFMSATVDTTGLSATLGTTVIEATQQRFPILRIPSLRPLEKCIETIALSCLARIGPDVVPMPEIFSTLALRQACSQVRRHVLDPKPSMDPDTGERIPGTASRPQGMLVIVNSHTGERSDTMRVATRLREVFAANHCEIGVERLASVVYRDPHQWAGFQRRIRGIEERNGRYVIVATNVVEMGVTFPSLDFVVTMDIELETNAEGGANTVVVAPLGANAFFQRIGRTGRRRPGVAFVTREGADRSPDWSSWDTPKLNEKLSYEPLAWAIAGGRTRELAFYLMERAVPDSQMVAELSRLKLPSKPHANRGLLEKLKGDRAQIRSAGLSDDGVRLNDHGRRHRDIGVVQDMRFGRLLSTLEGSSASWIAVVASAAESIPFASLLGRNASLDANSSALELVEAFDLSGYKVSADQVRKTLAAGGPSAIAKCGAPQGDVERLGDLLTNGYLVSQPRSEAQTNLLILRKACFPLDAESELVSIWHLARHFFNRYTVRQRDRSLEDFERDRVRRAMQAECLTLGLFSASVLALLRRVGEVLRRTRRELGSESSPPFPQSVQRVVQELASRGVEPNLLERYAQAQRQCMPSGLARGLPQISQVDRAQFLLAVRAPGVFPIFQLSREEDHHGRETWVGTSKVPGGRLLPVRLSPGRTSIRLTGDRVRVLAVPEVKTVRARDGSEEQVVMLNHLTRA